MYHVRENRPDKQEKTMAKIIITRGLPASGKSTWASKQVREAENNGVVRVNKDLLRTMLHADRHGKGTEAQVLKARDAIISTFLRSGVDVIVDDTNFAEHHIEKLGKLAERHGAEVVIEDFTHVDIETCIERDSKRTNPVGRDVIVEMYHRYLA